MSKSKINFLLSGLLLGLILNAIPSIAQEGNRSDSTKKRLPSVAPISPTNRAEEDVVVAPDLYNRDSEMFQYFRNSLDEKVISTAERDRQAHLKKLQERAKINPMDRPAADGSKFIDIYAPSQILNDGTPFRDSNDPDDRYAEAENSLLAKAIEQLDLVVMIAQAVSGTSNGQSSNGMPGPGTNMPSMSSEIMKPGPGMSGTANQSEVAPEKNKKNDTKLIFEDSDGTNPFAEAKVADINAETSFDFFKADREFKEKAATQNPSAMMGPAMMGPGMMGPGMMGPAMGGPGDMK